MAYNNNQVADLTAQMTYANFSDLLWAIVDCEACNSFSPTCGCRHNWADIVPARYFAALQQDLRKAQPSSSRSASVPTLTITPAALSTVFAAFCVRATDVAVVVLGQEPSRNAVEVTTQNHGSRRGAASKHTVDYNSGFAFCTSHSSAVTAIPTVRHWVEELYNCLAPLNKGLDTDDKCTELLRRVDLAPPEHQLSSLGPFLARQGVLLLNSALTLANGTSLSHQSAWRKFVRMILGSVATARRGRVVLVTLGTVAREASSGIGASYLASLYAGHPSLENRDVLTDGAPHQFIGSNVFRRANDVLTRYKVATIAPEDDVRCRNVPAGVGVQWLPRLWLPRAWRERPQLTSVNLPARRARELEPEQAPLSNGHGGNGNGDAMNNGKKGNNNNGGGINDDTDDDNDGHYGQQRRPPQPGSNQRKRGKKKDGNNNSNPASPARSKGNNNNSSHSQNHSSGGGQNNGADENEPYEDRDHELAAPQYTAEDEARYAAYKIKIESMNNNSNNNNNGNFSGSNSFNSSGRMGPT